MMQQFAISTAHAAKQLLTFISWKVNYVIVSKSYIQLMGLVVPFDDMNCVDNGLGIGFLPEGTNQLPDPMLTYHQWSPEGNFTKNDRDITNQNTFQN